MAIKYALPVSGRVRRRAWETDRFTTALANGASRSESGNDPAVGIAKAVAAKDTPVPNQSYKDRKASALSAVAGEPAGGKSSVLDLTGVLG